VQVACTINYGRSCLWKEMTNRAMTWPLPNNREYLKDPKNQPADRFFVFTIDPEAGRRTEAQDCTGPAAAPRSELRESPE